MSEHSKLVAEIKVVEKMTIGDRLKHARKQRNTQLKKWVLYEKQLELQRRRKISSGSTNGKSKGRRGTNNSVHFMSNVVLLEAAARNDVEEVALLLDNDLAPDVTNDDGLTAMHQCCIDDSVEIIQLLMNYGANINARDSELWTPLHTAATCGNRHLCQLLIGNGAELLAVNADGNMPYDICDDESTLKFIESEMSARGITQEQIDETRLSTETQMLKDLIEYASHDNDMSFKDLQGATPLHIAAANGYTDVVVFLLSCPVLVDAEDNETWQPIHAAACWGHQPLILELLVQHGAELDAKTKRGETPFDLCEDPDMKQRIVDMMAEIDAKRSRLSKVHCRKKQTNTRNACIRRSSIRVRHPLFLKEVKEEAVNFGKHILDESTEGEIGDDSSKYNNLPASQKDDIPLIFPENDISDKELDVTKHTDTSQKRIKDVPKKPIHKPLHSEHVVHESERSQSNASHSVPAAIANSSPEKRGASKLPGHVPIVNMTAEPEIQIDQMHVSKSIYSIRTVSHSSTIECSEWEMMPEVRYSSETLHGTLTNLSKQYSSLQRQGSIDSICSLKSQVQSLFLGSLNSDHQQNNASLNKPETSPQNDETVSVLQSELPERMYTDHENTRVGNDEKLCCCVLL